MLIVASFWLTAQAVCAQIIIKTQGLEAKDESGSGQASESLISDGDYLGVVGFFPAIIGVLGVIAVVKVRGISLARGLDLRAPKLWVWPATIVVTPFILVALGSLMQLFAGESAIDDRAGIGVAVKNTDWLILLLLGVSVGAPFFEEFLFRGLLHSGLRQSFLGVWGSAIATAALFSVVHGQYQDISAFGFLFLLGLLFVAAREITGSLWVPILMHSIQNFLATMPLYLILNGYIPTESLPEDYQEFIQLIEEKAQADEGAAPIAVPPAELPVETEAASSEARNSPETSSR